MLLSVTDHSISLPNWGFRGLQTSLSFRPACSLSTLRDTDHPVPPKTRYRMVWLDLFLWDSHPLYDVPLAWRSVSPRGARPTRGRPCSRAFSQSIKFRYRATVFLSKDTPEAIFGKKM